jgi:hypothetical protein
MRFFGVVKKKAIVKCNSQNRKNGDNKKNGADQGYPQGFSQKGVVFLRKIGGSFLGVKNTQKNGQKPEKSIIIGTFSQKWGVGAT